jgi:hypothetical protein
MRRLAFLSILLAPVVLPAQTQSTSIPTPEAFFGFRMGADREVAGWPEIRRYFERVAAASNRVELLDAGPTTNGNRMIAAVISAPENIARLEEIRTENLRLADPRSLNEPEARAIAARNPVIVAIGASIHASEIGATQAANELLHTLASADTREVASVLRNVVIVLLPSLNPDGHTLVVDWYRKWQGTAFEGGPMPWLYHRYVGHDINRDAFMMNMAENRTLADFFYRRWHPQVFLAMHQMGSRGARFFVPPNYDPIDPNYDPLIWRTAGLLGHAMALAMEEDGRSGVVSNALYDYFWPGYEDSAPLGHNTVCLLTEVASVRVATPITIAAAELEGSERGLAEYRPQINFPNPWSGGVWRLRDIVDYDLSALRGLLSASARYREDLLVNFYRMGRNAVAAGRSGAPFAFVIPPGQFDPHAAHKLRQLLIDGAVEVERSLAPFRVGDTEYPTGTDLVLMAQPFRAYAKTLLEKQTYPARRDNPDAPPERPYDVAGWTLPLQMGVAVDRIEQTFDPPASRRLDRSAITPAQLSADRKATTFIVDGRGTSGSIAINRLQTAGLDVSWTTAPLEVDGFAYAPGALLVGGGPNVRSAVEKVAVSLGLRASGLTRARPLGTRRLGKVRVGLYKSWVENTDEGWTRWILEQYEFPFETLTDQDIRRGNLRDRLDAIILSSASSDRLFNGHAAGTIPPEYAGGLGTHGAAALKHFVDAGGTLVALDAASEFAINLLALPVRDVLRSAPADEFFCPGSLVRITLDQTNALTYGMPASAAAFFAFGSGFELTPPTPLAGTEPATPSPSANLAARYARQDVLLSGWLEGERAIAGQGAIVDAQIGTGRAVLFGFRVQHRAQALGTLRLMFNSIHTAPSLPPTSPRRRSTPLSTHFPRRLEEHQDAEIATPSWVGAAR